MAISLSYASDKPFPSFSVKALPYSVKSSTKTILLHVSLFSALEATALMGTCPIYQKQVKVAIVILLVCKLEAGWTD